MATADNQATLDPLLEEDGPPLPGTGSRAFWTGLAVVVLALVWGLATYLILTGLTPIAPRGDVVVSVLAVNLALMIAMLALIGMQIYGLWRAWQRRIPGARLHARIVALFSVLTALPALFLAVAATTTFSRSLDNWFNRQTTAIVENSLDVANAYLEEHGQVIRTDIVNMAKDIDDAAAEIGGNTDKLRDLVLAQAALRDLQVAYIIDRDGAVKVAALEEEKIPYVAPPKALITAADAGHIPLLMPVNTFRVAAIAKLTNIPGSFLYVARGVNPKVVRYLRRTEAGVAEYAQLRARRGGLKFAHALMYSTISLTALLAAVWVGLWFAGNLVAPIRRLIRAAQQVARGNLAVELPVRRGEGDLRRLSINFNHMTKQIERQQSALRTANTQLTERRRFMEAVLSGVSAGVLGLDRFGSITLANRSAEKLLARDAASLSGRALSDVVPEFWDIARASSGDDLKGRAQDQVTLAINGEERVFAVRVTRESQGEEGYGYVVTFDDVTELVSAQRTSAWADIARRIAHEIKNPLTPIQLSAERIRRKYASVITEDREVFDRCTETIIRQVGDVSRMVDEFSAFARMPKPQMEPSDIREVVREPVFLFQMSTSDITFDTRLPKEAVIVLCDRRLISQAMTNLVKNAAEAIHAMAESPDKEPGYRGRIETIVRATGNRVEIEVIDNGPGLPKQNRARLLEPYVTTKGAKGTGLGLAIVQRVIEQHGGTLTLEDAPPAPGRTRGALLRITLPAAPAEIATTVRPKTAPQTA